MCACLCVCICVHTCVNVRICVTFQESKDVQLTRSGDRLIAALQESETLKIQLEKAVSESGTHKARMMALEIKVADQKNAFKEAKQALKQEVVDAQAEVARLKDELVVAAAASNERIVGLQQRCEQLEADALAVASRHAAEVQRLLEQVSAQQAECDQLNDDIDTLRAELNVKAAVAAAAPAVVP